jgi:hypothetical protein
MLKWLKAALVVLILKLPILQAELYPPPGRWNILAEYLYLLPSIENTYFVMLGPPSVRAIPRGDMVNNDFGFHSGFRVGGQYAFYERGQTLEAYYTRLSCGEKKLVAGTDLFAAMGGSQTFLEIFGSYTGSASADTSLLYQRGDLVFSQVVFCECGFDLGFVAGVEAASVQFDGTYVYVETGDFPATGTVEQRTRHWGVGPELGLYADYALCGISPCLRGFSVTSSASGSLLASKVHSSNSSTIPDVSFIEFNNIDFEPTWKIVPAFHAKVGLSYARCFTCFGAALEIGYEFTTYLRNLQAVALPDSMYVIDYNNFDLQGLYLSLTVGF